MRFETMRRRAGVVIALGLVACAGQTPSEPAAVATSITLSSSNVGFASLGESVSILATVRDQSGLVMTGQPVSWSSSDQSVASVAGGTVTAHLNGTATVTATSGTASASAFVTVQQVPATVAVEPGDVSFISLGDTARLSASVLDAQGNSVPNAAWSWTSGDPAIASVSDEGVVTALLPGSVVIVAESGDAFGLAEIDVTPLPVLTLEGPDSVSIGETLDIAIRLRATGFSESVGVTAVEFSFDPAALQFSSIADSGTFSTTAHDNGTGVLRWLRSEPTGFPDEYLVLTVSFDVVGGSGTVLEFAAEILGAFAASTFEDLTPAVVLRDGGVHVR